MKTLAFALAAVVAASATPALAQKSKDTLRYPLQQAENILDPYLSPGTFHYGWAPSVYDNLLGFNPTKGEFVGQLAKSFSQPDPSTYIYELKTDIKWQDGTPFTADDVVYTINYLIDPKVTLRYKAYWQWIKSVEKLGPYTVKITANAPVPDGFTWMTGPTPIYPKHLHEPLANKADFGAHPVGTGPFAITKFDKNSGIVAERYEGYKGTPTKPRAGIKTIVAEPMPDVGTVVAAMLTDKADMASDLPPDQAEALVKTGRFETELSPPAMSYSFLGFPTKGWENVKALADVRVRLAIAKAIDRKVLKQVIYGDLASQVEDAEGLCSKVQLGCGYTRPAPAYDPEGAKKLLAEAGYADGFDLVISCFPSSVPEVTAVAGMLRQVGVRATVRQHTIAQRVQLLSAGKVDAGYYGWSGGASFDASGNIARHFASNEYEDFDLTKMASDTFTVLDDKKRREAVAKVMDYANEHAYVFPMTINRPVLTHIKDVQVIQKNEIRQSQVTAIHEFAWK